MKRVMLFVLALPLSTLGTQQASATNSVLLFAGTGTHATAVAAVKTILNNVSLSYDTVDSAGMDAMSETTLKSYRLFIVPGGDSIQIGKYLKQATTAMIRRTVQVDGLHYLGICAGAFFGGSGTYNNLNLTNGVWFDFYKDYPTYHIEAVDLTFPQAVPPNNVKDAYWQDGPELDGQGVQWGTIVSKYAADGTPAVIQGASGVGWVVLTGVHFEAPDNTTWRLCCNLVWDTSYADDAAYAGTLVLAAYNGTDLPHY